MAGGPKRRQPSEGRAGVGGLARRPVPWPIIAANDNARPRGRAMTMRLGLAALGIAIAGLLVKALTGAP